MKPLVCIALLLALVAPFSAPAAAYSIPTDKPLKGQNLAVNGTSTDPWAGYALLKHIASCESWGDPNKDPREFLPDGQVLRGYPNPEDVGLAQINLPTWGATAYQLGFNLYTYQGNLAMAKWIFDHFGDAPWKYSEKCWGVFAMAG